MQLLPSSLRMGGVRIVKGGQEWLREAAIEGELAMAAHTRAQASGVHKLLMADAVLNLKGVTAGMELSFDDKGKLVTRLVPGAGRIEGGWRCAAVCCNRWSPELANAEQWRGRGR